jgi:DNA-binding MarR family transcriptional regulator
MHQPRETIPLGALVSIIHRTHHIVIDERMKPFGLSSGQLFTLLHLARQQGITQDTLARRFHIDKATIARAVRKLEDAGYVTRTVDPANRRAVRVALTDRGERIIPEILAIDREWEEETYSGLTAAERLNLYELLRKIARNSLKMTQATGDNHYAEHWTRDL